MKIVLQLHCIQALLLQINKNLDKIFSLDTKEKHLKTVSYTSRMPYSVRTSLTHLRIIYGGE